MNSPGTLFYRFGISAVIAFGLSWGCSGAYLVKVAGEPELGIVAYWEKNTGEVEEPVSSFIPQLLEAISARGWYEVYISAAEIHGGIPRAVQPEQTILEYASLCQHCQFVMLVAMQLIDTGGAMTGGSDPSTQAPLIATGNVVIMDLTADKVHPAYYIREASGQGSSPETTLMSLSSDLTAKVVSRLDSYTRSILKLYPSLKPTMPE